MNAEFQDRIIVKICKMLYEMRKREKIVKCLGVRY